MKRVTCCMLVLCMAALLSIGAAECAPGPTPEPQPITAGYVPAMTNTMAGVDSAQWQESFFAYADAHNIPVEGGFTLVTELARRVLFDSAA